MLFHPMKKESTSHAVQALISVAELQERLRSPQNIVVFDVRHDLMDFAAGRRAYEEEHLPGAYFLDNETDLCAEKTGTNGRHPLPNPYVFARLLGQHGVNKDTLVVAYDSSGSTFAAHLWWMLRWIGHEQVRVLDGGWTAWKRAGLPTQTGVETPLEKGCVIPVTHHPRMVVSLPAVFENVADPQFTLLDARAAERFAGWVEPIDPIPGRIPHSLNRPHLDNLEANGLFKPLEQLRAEFTAILGVCDPYDIVHTCGSGVTACVNLMVMEMLGWNGSRLYAGSWSEWCSDLQRPMVQDRKAAQA